MTEGGHRDGVRHADQAPHHLAPGPGLPLTHLDIIQRHSHVMMSHHTSIFIIKKQNSKNLFGPFNRPLVNLMILRMLKTICNDRDDVSPPPAATSRRGQS